MSREYYIVRVDRPRDVTIGQMTGYIEDAVATLCGSKHPDDPISELHPLSVRVHKLTKPRAESALSGEL